VSSAACVTSEAPGGISEPPASPTTSITSTIAWTRACIRPWRATDGERSTDDDERGRRDRRATGVRERVLSLVAREGKDAAGWEGLLEAREEPRAAALRRSSDGIPSTVRVASSFFLSAPLALPLSLYHRASSPPLPPAPPVSPSSPNFSLGRRLNTRLCHLPSPLNLAALLPFSLSFPSSSSLRRDDVRLYMDTAKTSR